MRIQLRTGPQLAVYIPHNTFGILVLPYLSSCWLEGVVEISTVQISMSAVKLCERQLSLVWSYTQCWDIIAEGISSMFWITCVCFSLTHSSCVCCQYSMHSLPIYIPSVHALLLATICATVSANCFRSKEPHSTTPHAAHVHTGLCQRRMAMGDLC